MAQNDRRFPYIRDVIRTGKQKTKYVAPQPTQSARAGSGLAAGGDHAIKQIQDKLVALGYLDAKHADGLVGRTRSATLDAVERFQRRNGLKPDRVLGGVNSETRRKLMLPAEKLVRAQ